MFFLFVCSIMTMGHQGKKNEMIQSKRDIESASVIEAALVIPFQENGPSQFLTLNLLQNTEERNYPLSSTITFEYFSS